MKRLAHVVISCLLLILLIAGSACSHQTQRHDDTSEGGAVYAYRSSTELALMHGAKATKTVEANFRNNTQPLFFTGNHRYVFSVTDDNRLAAIDTQEQRTMMVDCAGCSAVQPYSNSSVIWWSDDGISQIDLSQDNPTSSLLHEAALPVAADDPTTRILAVHNDDVFVAHATSEQSAPETLYVVNAGSGEVRALGATAANTPIRSAAVNQSGTLFGYAAYDRENPACGNGIIGIIDVRSAAQTTASPQVPQENVRTNISRLWWDSDDTANEGNAVNVIFTRWDCSSPELKQLSAPSVWTYAQGAWTQAERGPLSQTIALGDGQRITVVPDATLNDFKGTLYLDGPDGRRQIAADVYAIAS